MRPLTITRRAAILAGAATSVATPAFATETRAMYGLIGKIRAQPGQRDALISILLEQQEMPGCYSYVVAKDPQDADAVWVTEVWESGAAHQASLSIPAVKDAISRARPMIAGFDDHHEIEPVGGIGLTGR